MKTPASFYSEGVLARARHDRPRRAMDGKLEFVAREKILRPDRQSAWYREHLPARPT